MQFVKRTVFFEKNFFGISFEEFYKRCLSVSDSVVPGKTNNGRVVCSGNTCNLKCNPGHSSYGGFSRGKCVKHRKTGKIFWNRGKLGVCRTCGPLEINENEMKVPENAILFINLFICLQKIFH